MSATDKSARYLRVTAEARAVIAASLWCSARDRPRIVCNGTTWDELSRAFPIELAEDALIPEGLTHIAAVGPAEQQELRGRIDVPDEYLVATPGETATALGRPPLVGTQAHARSSDPSTSHDAARSLTPETLRESQLAVLLCLALGPATDERLAERYEIYRETMLWPKQSASGLRSRRAELTRAEPPMVRDSGEREILASGRKGIVWETANSDTIPAVSRNPNEQEENQ